MKETIKIVQHDTELRTFCYRLEKLYRKGDIKLPDVYAILLRHCHKRSWRLVEKLWDTYFPEIEWQGELASIANCKVLYCPGCDSFLGIDQFEYRSNAKLMRSRLCVGCLNKWRKDRQKGKLPWQKRVANSKKGKEKK